MLRNKHVSRETGGRPGHVRIGALSVRLFLVRLRPRRARLRFTGQYHRIKDRPILASRA